MIRKLHVEIWHTHFSIPELHKGLSCCGDALSEQLMHIFLLILGFHDYRDKK